MRTTRTAIDSGWEVRLVERAGTDPRLALPPLPAQVPGHVHLDLQRAGVIPDPFSRLHERDVAWVDDEDWSYETSFYLDAVPDGEVFVTFGGLDTVAEISLNGEPLGRTDNMFVPHEFSAGPSLRPGDNRLAVIFRAARRVGLERQTAWTAEHEAPRPDHFLWSARSFVRKAQYMFGWDWGPILISCGIWRPVELTVVPCARLLDWRYDVTFAGDRAEVRVEATVERAAAPEDTPLTLEAVIDGAGPAQTDVPAGRGRLPVSLTLGIEGARRWSPDDPYLYPLHLTVRHGETPVDKRAARVGLRTVELVSQADASGEGFRFRVNGEDHFCKGANWIPADSFPSRSYDDEPRLRSLLRPAKDAGFTMLRVWGGGMYESETFYSLCDELGLLVWQDFPYACAYYPDDPEALEVAAAEATAAVRRLRVHPSLALWCGNNENHQMFHDNWAGLNPPRYLGRAIYETVLPAIVAAEDPATPYWPSSAYGGDDPNSPDIGDRHNWDVWHAHGGSDGDWPYYARDRARFCSEFGFASSCGVAAWDTCLAPADRDPGSPAVRWHDKTGKAYETYLGYVERHFPPIRSLDDLVYYSQLNQAEAMAFGVEHYRRLKGRCWGTLIWQLDDCWPVQSWAMIDYLGEPKAVSYAARRFYAPVLLSILEAGGAVEAHVTNDLRAAVSGRLTLRVARFDGTALHTQAENVSMEANGTGVVGHVDLQELNLDRREVYVHGALRVDGTSAPIETVAFLSERKDLRLPDPQLSVVVEDTSQGPAVRLEAGQFAAYVRLSAPQLGPLRWTDNFFHLQPGEQRRAALLDAAGLDADALRESLTVRSLRQSP